MIRGNGVLALSVLLSALIVFVVFFLDDVVKKGVQKTLEPLHGAKIDIKKCQISYAPLTIHFFDVEIADPENEMKNNVEFKEITFTLSFSDVIRRRLIISDLSFDGFQANTTREKSGALDLKKERSKTKKIKKHVRH